MMKLAKLDIVAFAVAANKVRVHVPLRNKGIIIPLGSVEIVIFGFNDRQLVGNNGGERTLQMSSLVRRNG